MNGAVWLLWLIVNDRPVNLVSVHGSVQACRHEALQVNERPDLKYICQRVVIKS